MRITRREFSKVFASSALGALVPSLGARGIAGPSQEQAPPAGSNSAFSDIDLTKSRLNPLRLRAVDLRTAIRLGVNHIYVGALDRRQRCMPFVPFNLTEAPTGAQHAYWGCPHMVGRFLDALAVSSEVIDIPPDKEADHALRDLLHNSLRNPSGFALDAGPAANGKRGANMHNCREVLLGLLALAKWKRCERSAELARGFIRTIEKATRETGMFPAPVLYEDGWGKPEKDQINSTIGRLIGALVKYYRQTKDDLAVQLAKGFAETNISKTFTTDGELTELAGSHLHSTEGTMTALLALGVLTGEKRYFEIGHRLYDVGLRRWRTSFGWAKERRDSSPGRGEANNTGDYLEAAVILASNGYPVYFRDAECFIRNGLLAAQVVNIDWIAQSTEPDTEEYVHSEIRRRAKGAFAFTSPHGYHSYNTDLMGGALQSLGEAYHAITTEDNAGCHVNMLFPTELPGLSIRSSLPEAGQLQIETKRPCTLNVRLPDWVERRNLKLRVNGESQTPRWEKHELVIGKLRPQTVVEIAFDQPRRHTQEAAPGYPTPYEIDWIGGTIVDMKPAPADGIPLY